MYSWRVAWAFVRRDFCSTGLLVYFSRWSNMLLNLVFWYFLSAWMKGSALAAHSALGGDYFTYSLIGFSLTQYVWQGFSTFVARLRTEQASGGLETLWTVPCPLSRLILLSSIWDFLFATVSAGLVLGMGRYCFGARLNWEQMACVIGIGMLTSVAMACLGLSLFSWTVFWGRVEVVRPLITQAMPVLSGVFFPVEILPHWLQGVVNLFPLRHAIVLARAVIFPTPSSVTGPAWVGLVAVTLFFLTVSRLAVRAALHQGRLEGGIFST